MKKSKKLLLASAVHGILAAYALPAQAKTDPRDALLERLEKRVQELERRLAEKEDKEAVSSKVAKSAPKGIDNLAASGGAKQELEDLGRKVRTLERKFEVEKEAAVETAKKTPKLEAGPGGFKFASADGQHVVRLRGSVQADGQFFANDTGRSGRNWGGDSVSNVGPSGVGGLSDRFVLQQARIWLEGNLWNSLAFKIMPDFGRGKTELADAFIDLHYFPFASLSAGKQKTPISLERNQGDADGAFTQRAYPTQLASNRDVGFMLHGEFAKPGYKTEYGGPVNFKDFISYQLGVFDGAADNASTDTDNNDDKEFTGRLWAHPFQHSGIAPLEGLGVGIAGSWSQPKQGGLANLSSPGQNKIVDYGAPGFKGASGFKSNGQPYTNTAVLNANGDHYRVYPQAYWYYGPFGLLGEYVVSHQSLSGIEKDNSVSTNSVVRQAAVHQNNKAWQIQASYVLTGEDNTFQSVKPRQPFNPAAGNWGAVQLVARYAQLSIDKSSFKNFGASDKDADRLRLLDPTRSVNSASTYSIGLNWFLTSNARIMADYELTQFEGGAGFIDGKKGIVNVKNRPDENAFMTRFQLAF